MKKPAKPAPRMVTNYAKPKPAKAASMKPWRGWCVVRHGAATTDASKSRWPLMDIGIARDERVVRVRVLVTEHGTPHPDTARVKAVKAECQSVIEFFHHLMPSDAQSGKVAMAREILRILSTPAKGRKPR